VSAPSPSSRVSPKISIRQVYPSGSFVLRKCGTPLSTATYWKPLHPLILLTSYVLRKMIRPSLGYSVALRTILIVTAPSMFIHEPGWYSKTLFQGLRRVSELTFCLTLFLTIFKAPKASTTRPAGHDNTSPPEASQSSIRAASCKCDIFSYLIYILNVFESLKASDYSSR